MNRFYTYYHKLSSPPIQRKKRSRKKFGLRRVFQLLQYFKCLVGRIYQRSLMEIGKLSSLPIILLRIIRGNNYDFTLRPEIILNLSNAHSNGKKKGREKKKKRRSIETQLFRLEKSYLGKTFIPPPNGDISSIIIKKKKRKEEEREVAIFLDCRSTSNSSKRKTTNGRVTVATELLVAHLYLRPIPLACFGKSDPRLLVRA